MHTRHHVLVVEDDDDVRLLCRTNLQLDGFRVSEAAGAEAALRSIRALRPDVVVLEPVMWPVDGWQVLSSLHDEPVLAETPVVVLTGSISTADQIRAWTLGAARFVAKPFHAEVLTAACRDAIAEPMAARTERQRRELDRLNRP